MKTIRIGRTKYKIPDPTKFDRLSADDLYTCVEQALSNATVSLDEYTKKTTEDRNAYLTLTEMHLETGLQALRAMIRKRVVVGA